MASLLDEVAALVASVQALAPDDRILKRLDVLAARLDEPLRVAIAGKVKAGKSTLLNALVGEELAPTDAGECTKIVTWYRDGHTYRVLLHPRRGEPVQRPFRREGGAIEVELGATAATEIDHLEVWWPSVRLRRHTLIDTPGIASISTEVSARTTELLGDEASEPAAADAVVYLLRHLHATDVSFLEAFHGEGVGHGTPVNAVAVLSRADEVGSCRLDAMEVAARVADRYATDPRVRRLCSAVVPVAGLTAQAAVTLTEDDHRCVAQLAAGPASEATALLLTADRFAAGASWFLVTEPERRRLLDRFGLFGLRLAERLVRTGAAPSAGALAAELARRSGLDELRQLLVTRFAGRSQSLRARSALATLSQLGESADWAEGPRLLAEVERISVGAHELAELRRLDELSTGALEPPAPLGEEMHRLLGGLGDSAVERLALDQGAGDDEVRAAAFAALARWQRASEHPLYTGLLRSAARDVVRSCEGLLADLESAGDRSPVPR
jgi:hypothetical protein